MPSTAFVPGATAQNSLLLGDLNPGSAWSGPHGFFDAGTYVLFAATGAGIGTELWRTNGTVNGTQLVKDIAPGGNSGQPRDFVLLPEGRVLFSANGELWSTDGTTAGTLLVADLNPLGISDPAEFTWHPELGAFVFAASDTVRGRELWITDGSAAGTRVLADLRPGSASSGPRHFSVLGNGRMLFYADDGLNGLEPWTVDASGARLVLDVFPGAAPGVAVAEKPAVLGSMLFFYGTDAAHGKEPWVSDGTPAGTRVLDMRPGSASTMAATVPSPAVFEGRAFFPASFDANGVELCSSDGTVAGTRVHADLRPGPLSSSPQDLTPAKGFLYGVATDSNLGRELFVLPAGSGAPSFNDILPGVDNSLAQGLVAVERSVYLSARITAAQSTLHGMRVTGTATRVLLGLAETNGTGFKSSCAGVVFAALHPIVGVEPFVIEHDEGMGIPTFGPCRLLMPRLEFSPPNLGQNLEIRGHVESSNSAGVLLLAGLRATRVNLGDDCWLRIDPTLSLHIALPFPDPNGDWSLTLLLPNNPSLFLERLHAQSVWLALTSFRIGTSPTFCLIPR